MVKNSVIPVVFEKVEWFLLCRQTSESTVTKLLSKASLKRKDKDVVWKFSREPLKKPLLRKTSHREDLRRAAIKSFIDILLYELKWIISLVLSMSRTFKLC